MYNARKVFIYDSENSLIGDAHNNEGLPSGTIISVKDGATYKLNEHTLSNVAISDISNKTEIFQDGTSGFIDYNDALTSSTPIALLADTWTTVTNDGQGAFTNKQYKPDWVSELLDVSTGAIDVSQLNLGDAIITRNDYEVTPNINNALLEFRYTLGTGLGAYTLPKQEGRLDSGAGIAYRKSLTSDYIYLGDSNTKENPIFIQVKLSSDGTLKNNGIAIQVIRN